MKNTPLREIASALGLEAQQDAQVTGYQVDSRRIAPGELFFALPGERTDGHHFLAEVKHRGGLAAVVSSDYTGPDHGLHLLPTPDVLSALQTLAKNAVRQSRAKIIAITGTMGKTTTKDFIATLLEGKFRVGKTYSSYNTKLTLPITVLNMRGDEEVLVLEMGMGQPGDLAALVEIAPPDVAVLTEVAMAHYGEWFPEGLAGVARAKAEVFGHANTKKAIVFHGLHQYPEAMGLIQCEKLTYSLQDRSADYFLAQGDVDERGVRAHRFELPFWQPHIVHNLLGALTVARAMGIEWSEMEGQVAKLQLPKMRFEQFERGGIVMINDAYNANPESVKAALACMPEPKGGGKRIAVLGRMAELGPYSEELHGQVGLFAQAHVDHLLTLADGALVLCEAFARAQKPAEHFTALEGVILRLQELMRPGDVVLVKGSRDLQMEQIFDRLSVPCFS